VKDRAMLRSNPSVISLVRQDIVGHLSFALARFGCPILFQTVTLAKGETMPLPEQIHEDLDTLYDKTSETSPPYPSALSLSAQVYLDSVILCTQVASGNHIDLEALAVAVGALRLVVNFPH